MNTKTTENESPLSEALDRSNSPRTKPKIEHSGRKSWSLMDRKTDQEVLQEMGVSILDPEDHDACEGTPHSTLYSRSLKRKRDIENVNPNVNCASSSPYSAKSPKKHCSPCPGPSKLRSPRSVEKCKVSQPTDQLLDTSFNDEYLVDEETPLAQVNSNVPFTKPTESRRQRLTSLELEEDLFIRRKLISDCVGEDSFNIMSDEMILSVFRWLPKRTLANCMLVCKRWRRVACDETLWQRLDLGNKTLNKDALGKILSRKSIIIRLANSEVGEWHPTTPVEPSRVQYLDLSITTIDRVTLNSLIENSPSLRKLSLESVQVDDVTCNLIGKCSGLETLNLTMAQGMTAEGVSSILEGCKSLQSLNISWCGLNEDALNAVVTLLPQKLQRLNLAGARILTNDMVKSLVERCPRLLELDLSDCSKLSTSALTVLQGLRRLEHLALSRCYLLPPHVLTKLNAMVSLQYLEVWGMLHETSLTALRSALPAIQINQFMFSAIARPTVGTRRTSVWGLRTRD